MLTPTLRAAASARRAPLREAWLSAFLRNYTQLPMPALSPTMSTGRIAVWKKKEGDTFKVDDVLCEVETDKAVVDFSAVEEGVIAKILVQAGGDAVPVGIPLALVVDDVSEIASAIEDYSKKSKAGATAKAAPTETKDQQTVSHQVLKEKSAAPQGTAAVGSGKPVAVSPSARSLLGEHVDFANIKGSGKAGRIMKEDAMAYLRSSTAEPALAASKTKVSPAQPSIHVASAAQRSSRPPAQSYWLPEDRGTFKEVPLTMMRRVIAQRLSESKERVPHAYATIEADIESALEARSSLKRLGMPIPSMNDLVVKACALALLDVPSLNVRVESGTIKPNEKVDISVAVATPGGLITPIIENADKKTPAEISSKMKDLAGRAKENKLKPAEFQGGSFTVSNLGMLGIDDFTAIINSPQVAILAVGSGKKSLVAPARSAKEVSLESVQSRTKMTVALSYDARVVNEFHAARFLQSFQSYMESPTALFSVTSSVTKAVA